MLLITSGPLPTRVPRAQPQRGRAAELQRRRKAETARIRQIHAGRIRQLELRGWKLEPLSTRHAFDGDQFRCQSRLSRPGDKTIFIHEEAPAA